MPGNRDMLVKGYSLSVVRGIHFEVLKYSTVTVVNNVVLNV